MKQTITPELKHVWEQTLVQLSGAAKRLFMASVVKGLGRGGARQAQIALGWDRTTVRKGIRELSLGVVCVDAFGQRGRKPLETKLPRLEADLREMGEAASQTDPKFRATQRHQRLTASEARRRLIEEKGYSPKEVPSERSLRRKLSVLGFKPRQAAESKPLRAVRKVPQTGAILETAQRINREAGADADASADADADAGAGADAGASMIHFSIGTKMAVPIGNLSRGGKSRQGHQAPDHDMEPQAKMMLFDIHRVATSETWLSFTTGNVATDFMADRLHEIWPTLKKTIIVHIPS
jgi:hypothetical protein